jgi:hypothetical protein
VRKGIRYMKVQNTSKQGTSAMLCFTAAKEWLPPMVVFKGLNLYTSWCEKGPKGTV